MAIRKQTAAQAPKVNLMDALYEASYGAAKSDETLRLAFVAAGGNHDDPKRVLMSARVAFSLNISREAALVVLGKKGNPKLKADAGDDVRTISEEKACGAARAFLSARLKAWGIKTTEARGGDRSKDSTSAAMNTEKLVTPGKPKIETPVDLGAYALAFAKSGYDLFLLNKEHSAVKSDMGAELMGAFADFAEEIREIVKQFAPK